MKYMKGSNKAKLLSQLTMNIKYVKEYNLTIRKQLANINNESETIYYILNTNYLLDNNNRLQKCVYHFHLSYHIT